jgi:hypothetical protein
MIQFLEDLTIQSLKTFQSMFLITCAFYVFYIDRTTLYLSTSRSCDRGTQGSIRERTEKPCMANCIELYITGDLYLYSLK